MNIGEILQAQIERLQQELIETKEHNRQLALELEKKDKVIDEMAEKLVEAHGWFYSEFDNYTKEDWKEYFYKKVEDKKYGI